MQCSAVPGVGCKVVLTRPLTPSPPPPGVVPPYSRPRPPGHAPGPATHDWRWAVGATPFGPYSSFAGVSGITQNAARRNLLLSHVSAALRASQGELNALDAFVAGHFMSPWAAAGIGDDKQEGRRHFLDTVVRCVGSFLLCAACVRLCDQVLVMLAGQQAGGAPPLPGHRRQVRV